MMSTGQSVAATGAIGTQLAAVIYWLGNWPIKPIDEPTSLAVSGLILAAIGLLIHRGTNAPNPTAPPAVADPKP